MCRSYSHTFSQQDIYHVLITEAMVKGKAPPGYWKKGQAVQFWEAWATEEGAYSKNKKVS